MGANVVAAWVGVAGVTLAQPERPPPVTVEAPAERTARATRADLARAYLRLERALSSHAPGPDEIPAINRRFDQASVAFFSGQYGSAIKTLGEMTASLLGEPDDAPTRAARSLAVRVTAVVDGGTSARVRSMHALGEPYSGPLELRLIGPDGPPPRSVRFTVETKGSTPIDAQVPLKELLEGRSPGTYTLSVAVPGGTSFEAARVSLMPPTAPRRASLESRLAAVPEGDAVAARAREIARARVGLLTDEPSPTNSAQFLADMHALADDLEREIAAVERGENPYARLAGDHWRVIPVAGAMVPCRVFAPASALAGNARPPLVVAFHGAGGDESMFFEGYGGGKIKDLADRHGFVCAAPLTYSGSSPAAFDALIDHMAEDFGIDRGRAYVLGHSMGAGAVTSLVSRRHGSIAGAACLAGGGAVRGPIPPMMVVLAELDPIVPPARVRRSFEEAARADLPVTIVEAEGWGHTLVVGEYLPRVVDFLLGHRLTPLEGGE